VFSGEYFIKSYEDFNIKVNYLERMINMAEVYIPIEKDPLTPDERNTLNRAEHIIKRLAQSDLIIEYDDYVCDSVEELLDHILFKKMNFIKVPIPSKNRNDYPNIRCETTITTTCTPPIKLSSRSSLNFNIHNSYHSMFSIVIETDDGKEIGFVASSLAEAYIQYKEWVLQTMRDMDPVY